MASQSNQMTLFFYTDGSVTSSGWNASISIGDPGNCGQNFTEASGKLFHPGSPGVYLDFQDCGYLITVTPGSTIQLSWDVFDVSFTLYRVSQQVWDMLNVKFKSSEKLASKASYV